MDVFLDTAKKLVEALSKPSVSHEFQDHQKDLEIVKRIVDNESVNMHPLTFVTPEKERYAEILNGEKTVEVEISRVVDVYEWQTRGHKKHFPKVEIPQESYRIFLDSVSFTGRTIEEVWREYGIQLAVLELMGKHAQRKIEQLAIKSSSAMDVSSYDGLWHLDDFVQDIQTKGKPIKPSEFVKDIYPKLQMGRIDEFIPTLAQYGIERKQTSPNLFLELARPSRRSYLGRSFYTNPLILKDLVPLIEVMESLYSQRIRS